MKNPIAIEMAKIKAPEACSHCHGEIWFDNETECWVSDTMLDDGFTCTSAPAGEYGIQSHEAT